MESLNPNKNLKEQFVSNLTGCSKLEAFLLITNLSAVILVRRCVGFISVGSDKKDGYAALSGKSLKASMMYLFVDYLCIGVPYILFMTVMAEWTMWSTAMLILFLIFLRLHKGNQSYHLQGGGYGTIRACISSYRVSVMLATCISILAVDFKIFPRRYAKTETYGTSLMDLGVGSFVLANALVSRQARGLSNKSLANALQSSSPLIILGFVRQISTSSVNYQVHVGEYGAHWNFFFSLAAVALLTSLFSFHPKHCVVMGSVILIGYQASLLYGLNEYLLSEERGANIVSQNKEGVLSIFGYWGLYLLGVGIGNSLFFNRNADTASKSVNLRINLWTLCFFFWSTTLLFDRYVEKISRRMCNLAYVSFTLASNLQALSIIVLPSFAYGRKISSLEEAFNRNLLASFLLANLFTGVVNLSLDTLSVSSFEALGILLAYTLALSVSIGFADFLGLKLKFW